MTATLTEEELLAFAGLARLLVQADGNFTEDERAALEDVSAELFGVTDMGSGPYREGPVVAQPPKNDAVWALLQRAQLLLPDEPSVRTAALGVTRQHARETIFGALYTVAAADVIDKSEWPLLDWLTSEWNISSESSGPYR